MRLKGETALQEGLWEPEPPAGAGGGGAVCSEQSRARRGPGAGRVVSVEAGVAEEAMRAPR